MINKLLLYGCVLFLVVSCRYPTSNVQSANSRPTLSFKNAPKKSTVWVDGIYMGEASLFNGNPKVLPVLPGKHEITVMLDNAVLTNQTIFVESENKVITVE